MSSTVTDRRALAIKRGFDSMEWHVHEFDDGRAYMLSASAGAANFSVHFTGEQWAEFQQLIGGTAQ